MAEIEREWILERQRFGIAKAKAAGKYKGRASKLKPDIEEQIIRRLSTTRDSKTKIAKDLGICRFTLYRFIAKIQQQQKKVI
jgi:DNA invertase Pin-like site-specific DNA recombinase